MANLPKVMRQYPRLIAHRGAGKEAPENTLSAFQLGADYGYTMFECDVRLSQDKVLFLLHDAELERTTNGQGLAQAQRWETLAQLDAGSWHSAEYRGERLFTLEALITEAFTHHFYLDIELKPNEGEAYETGIVAAHYLQQRIARRGLVAQECSVLTAVKSSAVSIVADNGFGAACERSRLQNQFLNQFLISSFSLEALQGAKATAPEITRALLLDDWIRGEAAIWQSLEDLECRGVILHYPILTRAFLERCHQSGLFVMVYTVNELSEIERLLKMGVDSIITDNMTALTVFAAFIETDGDS